MAKKTSKLKNIDPQKIQANQENPRIHFPEISMESLAGSIDEIGIQVPVTVYMKGKNKDDPHYILIDGERRWRCAKILGLNEIPAIVVDEPNRKDNLLRMFHIHMVREPWDDMPTAWGLKEVVKRTGKESPKELAELTGLSQKKIKQLLFATELPDDYQKLIDKGEIPLNFFYELKSNLINPLSKKRPEIYQEFGEKELYKAFVNKRLNNVNTDTVELRKIREIINVAADEAEDPEDTTSELDDSIRELIKDLNKTIEETYEDTVEMVVEADKFAKQCQRLIRKYDRLIKKADSEEEKNMIHDAIQKLLKELSSRI